MIEMEVARLRKLRSSALRVRAVARALAGTRAVEDDPVLDDAACAAWRLARTVTGRLRAHPHARFQRDAGLGAAVSNTVVAAGAVLGATSRARAFRGFSRQLHMMTRELEDARALTWAPDLSDSFGRSLAELRPLLAQANLEAHEGLRARPASMVNALVKGSVHATAYGAATQTDWPYLAL